MIHLSIYNIYFVIGYTPNSKEGSVVLDFIRHYKTYRSQSSKEKTTFTEDKYYYTLIDNTVYLPITLVTQFVEYLKAYGVLKEQITVEYKNSYDITHVDYAVNPEIIPRDYQESYIDILTKNTDIPFMLIDLPTGKGKSLIAAYTIAKLKCRAAMFIIPMYIEKWIEDFNKYLGLESYDIYIISGIDSINRLYENIASYSNVKLFIFSIRTTSLYIENYDKKVVSIVKPEEMLTSLGVGVAFNDETHQEYHALYTIFSRINVKRVIGSTATLDSHDRTTRNMYNILFPATARVSNLVVFTKYVNIVAVSFKILNAKRIRCKTINGYSHIMVEKYIMRKRSLLTEYTNMLFYYIEEVYISKLDNYSQKLLIYANTIDFCTYLASVIKNRYPELDVRRYVEADSYENIMTANITVSTVKSAGTALDIPNLIAVIQTVSINSLQANLQTVGRLREIPGKEVYFYYLYTPDIHSQREYHNKRRELLAPRCKTFSIRQYDKALIA